MLYINKSKRRSYSYGRKTCSPGGLISFSNDDIRNPVVAKWIRDKVFQPISEDEDPWMYGRILLQKHTKGAIAFKRTYALGDLVMMSAVMECFFMAKHTKPILLTSDLGVAILGGNPYCDLIEGMDVPSNVTTLIDLNDVMEQGESRLDGQVNKNRIELLCEYLDVPPQTLSPRYYIKPDEIRYGEQFAYRFRRPYIGISPCSTRKEKEWGFDNWVTLCQLLADSTHGTVFVFDKRGSVQIPNTISVQGFKLRQASAIGFHMDLFVTQDSLWLHLASALGVPQVSLFSCTDGQLATKGYNSVRVIQRTEWECSPCWYAFGNNNCALGQHPKCMNDITVEEVRHSIMGQLEVTNGQNC